uniref:Uncharacterized protein n=1 Tax=Opuntia streptacantha TaxID=393608 RepID=A0A7C9EJ06_OPUST
MANSRNTNNQKFCLKSKRPKIAKWQNNHKIFFTNNDTGLSWRSDGSACKNSSPKAEKVDKYPHISSNNQYDINLGKSNLLKRCRIGPIGCKETSFNSKIFCTEDANSCSTPIWKYFRWIRSCRSP